MMKELSLSLTLAGLIGLSSLAAQHCSYETQRSETVELQPAREHQTEESKQRQLLKRDPYWHYINTLEIAQPFINKKNIKVEGIKKVCDEGEIKKEHAELLKWLAMAEAALPTATTTGMIHVVWSTTDDLIYLDVNLANCKYKNDSEKYQELMEDSAEHYKKRGRFAGTARIYYHLSEYYSNKNAEKSKEYLNKAREYFRKRWNAAEEIIKLTPLEELAAIRDENLQKGNYWSAGKIEWYLGNKERGRSLIMQSPEYQRLVKESKESVKEGKYYDAVQNLWGDLIPFYKEIMKELCGKNKKCLREVRTHVPAKNYPLMMF